MVALLRLCSAAAVSVDSLAPHLKPRLVENSLSSSANRARGSSSSGLSYHAPANNGKRSTFSNPGSAILTAAAASGVANAEATGNRQKNVHATPADSVYETWRQKLMALMRHSMEHPLHPLYLTRLSVVNGITAFFMFTVSLQRWKAYLAGATAFWKSWPTLLAMPLFTLGLVFSVPASILAPKWWDKYGGPVYDAIAPLATAGIRAGTVLCDRKFKAVLWRAQLVRGSCPCLSGCTLL